MYLNVQHPCFTYFDIPIIPDSITFSIFFFLHQPSGRPDRVFPGSPCCRGYPALSCRSCHWNHM